MVSKTLLEPQDRSKTAPSGHGASQGGPQEAIIIIIIIIRSHAPASGTTIRQNNIINSGRRPLPILLGGLREAPGRGREEGGEEGKSQIL